MKIKIKNKKTLIITTLLCLAPILFGIAMWNQLPEMMPTHFGLNNEPNDYMPKAVAVFILPLIVAVLELLCVIFSSIDPKKENISEKSLIPLLWMMPAVSWVCSFMTYGSALGYQLNISAIVFVLLGFLLLALGNYLPKNAQNYTVGIKTSWALNDENNWNYANRIGGISFTVTGAVLGIMGIIAFFLKTSVFFWILALIILISGILIPVIASYRYYRKHL